MLRTNYPVTLEVDNENYEVIYTPLSDEKHQELNQKKNDSSEKFKELDSRKRELKYKKHTYKLNDEMLLETKGKEKLDLLKEQKTLSDDIYRLGTEITKKSTEIDPIEREIEDLNSRYYDLSISGKDSSALKAIIDKTGLTFSSVIAEIDKMAAEQSEKK